MDAKLVAYRHVPQGFEMLINEPNFEMGRVWNFWFNIKLTDDPEKWDDEISLVNDMQNRLGQLNTDHRLIRAHMAEFCRSTPLFPRSIDLLCEEIGLGRLSVPVILGCLGRGLLKALGYHALQSVSEQRKDLLTGYVRSLHRWLAYDNPESLMDSKVFGFLGQSTHTKESVVERLLSIIGPDMSSILPLKKLAEDVRKETQGELVLEGAGLPLNCLRCDVCSDKEAGPACGCSDGMLIDAILLCVGASDKTRSVLEEYNCFTQECILTYCLAINSWLRDSSTEPVSSMATVRYTTDSLARQLILGIHASLGKRSEVKEWLAACLLKTVKDNWHKSVELIDRYPQATSWFKDHQPAC